MRRRITLLAFIALGVALISAALPPRLGVAQQTTPTPTVRPTRTPRPTHSPTPARISAQLTIDAAAPGAPFSPRMLGNNLPAWLKRQVFEHPVFRARVAASGIRMLRIPGGSWSDEYGWLSCETARDQPGAFPCRFPWAARPTDFINFLEATGIEAMYTVNVNYTAQEAAALVAFFNSAITDTTRIGTDIRGTDWYTAGRWAQLRAAGGNPKPLGIQLWEIGNEVYGGKPTVKGCPKNGWENTWTCSGQEYIKGNTEHDGFIKMRAAMLAVDPTIQVGAVGHESSLGQGWAYNVLLHGSQVMDFYVVHTYPQYFNYGSPRREIEHIVGIPQRLWPKIKAEAETAFAEAAQGRPIPIVVNEFGIVPEWGKEDFRNYMNKHVAALFIADSIGQMITNGYAMAAHWNVMNGPSPELSNRMVNEFGLMFDYERDPKMTRQPKYYVYPIWARFGDRTLPATSSADPARELSIYAGRARADTVSVLVINKSDRPADVQITLNGVQRIASGLVDALVAPSADATKAAFNGVIEPKDDLSDAPPRSLRGSANSQLGYTFDPYSITLLRLRVQ